MPQIKHESNDYDENADNYKILTNFESRLETGTGMLHTVSKGIVQP